MDTVPPELLRYFISFLPLTSLIAARGVSIKWRTLALTASIHPARKSLLDLSITSINHPKFLSHVERMRPCLHQFDREGYIAGLKSHGCLLPDVFEMWVLEWPSKAVHFLAWPGLEREPLECNHGYHYEVANPMTPVEDALMTEYYLDSNHGAGTPPVIDTIPVPKKEVATDGSQTHRALALFDINFYSLSMRCRLWMVVDEEKKIDDRRSGWLIWTFEGHEEDWTPQPKKICYDSPLGLPTDRLIDFLGALDVSRDDIDGVVQGKFWDRTRTEWQDGRTFEVLDTW